MSNYLRISVCIEFERGTPLDLKLDMMLELNDGLNAIMEAGQNTFSRDGVFYNDVDSYETSWSEDASMFHLDVEFKDGTDEESMEDLKSDIDDSIFAMFDAGNSNGDGEFYDAVEEYEIVFR